MTINSTWYRNNPERAKKNGLAMRERIRLIRSKILKELGSICCKCGFSDMRALQIDHVNSGGCQEQRRFGTGMRYLNMVSLSIFKSEGKYQLLCANCNVIKKYELNEFRGQIKNINKEKEKTLFDAHFSIT